MAGPSSALGFLGVVAETAVAAFLALLLFTWFLRRRAAARAPTGHVPAGQSPLISLAAGRLALIALALSAFAIGAAAHVVRASDAYRLAVSTAHGAARFGGALGDPVSEAWFPDAQFRFGEPPTAELAIPVAGPRAHGTLKAAATKTSGGWKLTRLVLVIETTLQEVDLLE